MPNITLAVDQNIIKKVRKIAVDRDTTLTAMVRDYLTSVAATDTIERAQKSRDLQMSFVSLKRPMGARTWSRDQLHDR